VEIVQNHSPDGSPSDIVCLSSLFNWRNELMVALNLEFEEVLWQVRSWPATARRDLARRLLESLEKSTEADGGESRGYPSHEVLGLLATSAGVPDDVECRRILEEELIRKSSP
jgi:hypothetical protein